MRILLSIPSLARGGAERQFAALAAGLAARGHQVTAVTLGPADCDTADCNTATSNTADSDTARPRQANANTADFCAQLGGARLVPLGKASRLDTPRVAATLASLLRREAPAVHYAFLPSCCVLGGLLSPFFPHVRLVMGVRASNLSGLPAASRLLLALEARLSRRARLVIANSRAGLNDVLARGFALARAAVVPNGIDMRHFRPDKAMGAPLRREWGADEARPLIGLVARLDPMKDHTTFLLAAAQLAARRPDARFVCVGAGPEAYARGLRRRAEALGLAERLAWAGARADMPAVYNALDVLCLSSACGEGFPNALAEALACGVPCVATNVGDAALVLGDIGAVAPPGDAAALADALDAMLERAQRAGPALAATCRERVTREFSLARMVEATEALLTSM
ncbi:MAG: hypothetical protein AUJ49_05715 [Desulfovibrionaceae bacterium CG1_02_65_16]|nr:MAG: hypothetical protein AUJ49_05715 [Desulfovibrionaceae bacterium CG1_02_65_16]